MPTPNDLTPEQNALAEELTREDDLGAVIRSHLYIENLLNQIISISLPHPEHLKQLADREYARVVRMALALGVNHELKSILNALGNLRNDFAHKLKSELNQEKTKSLYSCLPEDLKNMIQKTIRNVYQNLP